MSIYTSTRVLPYVYICTHKETNEFYIGFRYANKTPSSEDFGISYHTSSKTVKENFNSFNFIIIAEFFLKEHAFEFEQHLINEHWENPLLLNGAKNQGGSSHIPTFKHKNHSDKTKLKMRNSHLGKPHPTSAETAIKISIANKGNVPHNKGKKTGPLSDEHKSKLSATSKGKPKTSNHKSNISKPLKGRSKTQSHIQNLSASLKGIPAHNKGVSDAIIVCPHCNKSGGTSAMKRWHFDKCKLRIIPLL